MNLNSAITESGAVTALYCRLSCDDDNEGESLSIENQKKLLTQYADEKGFFNTRFYVDDGISGTTFERDGFKAMLNDVQNGEVKTVIVKDMSRFGRDYIQVGMYTEILFPQNNVRFIAINDSYDSANGDNDFIPFKNIMNEWYARRRLRLTLDTSKKIKAVNRAKARAGEHLTSNVPYGYIKNPDNPKQWIIDEEAAEVVREIFQLYLQGMNTNQISASLSSRQILVPTAYKSIHGIVNRKFTDETKFLWNGGTITRILENGSYVGNTVNGKSMRKSFKIKKRINVSQEEWQIVPNTQEAIIDCETWNLVQKIRQGRRRNVKHNHQIPVLSGHLFCADCGRKLYYVKPPKQAEYYCCSGFRKRINSCTGHYIRADVVEQLLIRQINNVMKFVSEYEDEFVRQVMERGTAEQLKQTNSLKKTAGAAKRRIEQIDSIVSQLYEDKVAGQITAEMFTKLSAKYIAEQKEQSSVFQKARKELSDLEAKKTDVGKIVAMVKKYSHITELSPQILNELVDKVVVHQTEKVDGKRQQDIEVYFNGVGQISSDAEKSPKQPSERSFRTLAGLYIPQTLPHLPWQKTDFKSPLRGQNRFFRQTVGFHKGSPFMVQIEF